MYLRKSPVAWQECEFVSLANAARIAGRTHGWARDAVATGKLEAVRLPTGGAPVVTVRSLRLLLASAGPVDGPKVPPARRPTLHLVASNP